MMNRLADPVSHVDHAVAEPALVQQFQLKVETGGQRVRPAAHDDGVEEEVQLVHQAGCERARREPRTPDGDVPPRTFFSRRTASGSNSRSSRVRALETASSVDE